MMLDFTLFFSLLALASSAGIVSEGDASAGLGESASFSCSLPNAAGVKQVTWQRLGHDESVHTVATFSDNFRQQVTEQYAGKVDLTVAELNATTIVIRNVTFADEGCYICTFNVYPSGTERQKSCLSVHGLSEITTSKASPDATEEKVASCRATGKSAPEFHWMCEGQEIKELKNTVKTNEDGTVTTTSTVVSLPPECNRRIVECVATSGKIKRSQHINLWIDEIATENASSRQYLASCFAAIVCVIIIICITIVLLQRRQKSSEKDRNNAAVP